MGKDREFETLINKYNLAVAQIQDLREQMSQKEQAWAEKDKRNKIVDDLTRDLCEHILAKNKNEMVLGKEYSWSNIKTDELVRKADKCFKEYNDRRSQDLDTLMNELESRAGIIQSLEEQIEVARATGDVDDLKNTEEVLKQAEEQEIIKRGTEKVPNRLREAAKAGKVDMIIEDDVMESAEDDHLLTAMADQHEKLTTMSVPHRKSEKVKKFHEDIKESAKKAHMIDLVDFSKDFSEYMWKVLEGIGRHGLSKYPDIEAYVLRSIQRAVPSSSRTAAKALQQKQVILETKVSTPLVRSVFAYQLSDVGIRLYELHFGKKPVVSELERVIAEHDNPEHGYGIMDVEKILKEKEWYTEISTYNRKHPIKIEGTNKNYIPDLMCTISGSKYKDYYEYERGLHMQTDFNAKCNKMATVTRNLYFVVPNQTVLKKIQSQTNEWVKSRGIDSLKNLKLKIVTAAELKKAEKKSDDFWQIVYDFNKGADPVKDALASDK